MIHCEVIGERKETNNSETILDQHYCYCYNYVFCFFFVHSEVNLTGISESVHKDRLSLYHFLCVF